ncbi:MAG: hypothetical protein ACEQSK_09475 [Sphingomonadaceae bacterium]
MMKHGLPLLLLATVATAQAAPIDALKPMAFLAGHCWKGDFPGARQSDEHCFQWMYDGQALRDVHTVRAPGKPDYVGESIYYYDSVAKRVEFLYVEAGGGVSRGSVEGTPTGLSFPPTTYSAAGQTLTYRVQWTRIGADAYEAFSEINAGDKWVTQFKLVLKRQ